MLHCPPSRSIGLGALALALTFAGAPAGVCAELNSSGPLTLLWSPDGTPREAHVGVVSRYSGAPPMVQSYIFLHKPPKDGPDLSKMIQEDSRQSWVLNDVAGWAIYRKGRKFEGLEKDQDFLLMDDGGKAFVTKRGLTYRAWELTQESSEDAERWLLCVDPLVIGLGEDTGRLARRKAKRLPDHTKARSDYAFNAEIHSRLLFIREGDLEDPTARIGAIRSFHPVTGEVEERRFDQPVTLAQAAEQGSTAHAAIVALLAAHQSTTEDAKPK